MRGAEGGSGDLDADLRRLKEAYNTDVLVSLMEQEEYERFGIADLTQRAEALGIEVLLFLITDVSTPRQSQTDEYATLVQTIVDRLARGEIVVIHRPRGTRAHGHRGGDRSRSLGASGG